MGETHGCSLMRGESWVVSGTYLRGACGLWVWRDRHNVVCAGGFVEVLWELG